MCSISGAFDFNAGEGCKYISCSGGAAPVGMGFSVDLWEQDLGQSQQMLANIAYAFHGLGGIIFGQGTSGAIMFPNSSSTRAVPHRSTARIVAGRFGWVRRRLRG